MGENSIVAKPKASPIRRIAIVVGALMGACCLCYAAITVWSMTPGARAAATERAATRTADAALIPAATATLAPTKPPPTDTPEPSATAPNTNTPQPSPTAVVEVDLVIGQTLADIEAKYGDPLSITDWDPGAFPSMPQGGQTREYAVDGPGDVNFLVDYDLQQIATGVQLNIGLSDLGYTSDDWRQAFALIGITVMSNPDREESNNLYWEDVNGYVLNTRWLSDNVLIYVNAYRPDLLETSNAPNVQATRTLAPLFTETPASPALATDTSAVPAATQPSAGNSITLISLTSPINAGSDASLVIQTTPGIACNLSYVVPSGATSEADGLGGTTADGDGRCAWSWRISSSTNPGTGHLFVSAGTANASFDIVIQ